MRSKVVNTLALALVLVGVGIGLGQEPKPRRIRVEEEEDAPRLLAIKNAKNAPQKSKLEEMLAEALKNNPDIRVAAAKLAEAEAELNRTRLQVTQKAVTLYYAIETQKKIVGYQETKFKHMRELNKRTPGSFGADTITETGQALDLAKAKLAELEAQLPTLLGKMQASAATEETPVIAQWHFIKPFDTAPSTPQVHAKLGTTHADKLRKVLQTPIKVDYKDMTFDAILDDLSKKVEGLSFRSLYQRGLSNPIKMSLRFENALPVYVILQALGDEIDNSCLFYVREYGILATRYKIPGALTVEEFLRQKPKEK